MYFINLFFFNDTATTEIYTLSLHDALPISRLRPGWSLLRRQYQHRSGDVLRSRSEEHTSELQSLTNLVCRLLLEKKKIHVKKALHSPAPSILTHFESLPVGNLDIREEYTCG